MAGLEALERALGYAFVDARLGRQALTHRSHGQDNNERLEFLGDAILNFVIAQALYRRFPSAREGQLTRLRAGLVKGATLAGVATELGVEDHLLLGAGERKSGGRCRESIRADAVEALIGAIYLDGGLDGASAAILRWFEPRLAGIQLDQTQKDAKTLLQELLQARRAPLPHYRLVAVEGPEHEQRFRVACHVSLLPRPLAGEGRSRRLAEQAAATQALNALETGDAV